MTAMIRRVARPRGELSGATVRALAKAQERAASADADLRRLAVAALEEGSFSAVSNATGLSTNTLQRWKREAGR